jgi:hypothetical protein
MKISGSCCTFSHMAVAAGMVKVNIPAQNALFRHIDVMSQCTIKKLATPPGRFK